MSGRRVVALLLTWCALTLAAPGARAEADVWEALESPEAVPSLLAGALDSWVSRWAQAGEGARSGDVVAYARLEDRRLPVAERFGAAYARAKDALDALGLAPRDLFDLSVVSVQGSAGFTGTVVSSSGKAILLRHVSAVRTPGALGIRKPADGQPTPTAVIRASEEALASLAEDAARAAWPAGAGSPTSAFCRAVLSHVDLPAETPVWLREALVAWLESTAFPETAAAPLHLCAGPAGVVVTWISPKARPSGTQARLLGRLVGAVLSGAGPEGRARLEKIATAKERSAAVLTELLGRDVAAALSDLGKEAAPGARRCDSAGTVPCPVCKGGKVELACPGCFGLGNATCPSCLGDNHCPAPGCCNGTQLRGEKAYDCSSCNGSGWDFCRTCDGKNRFPCKVCSGSGRATRPCLACRGVGRVPCPDAGAPPPAAATSPAPCSWCTEGAGKGVCPDCVGTGFVGCKTCRGSGTLPCPKCLGLGCSTCDDRGWRLCPAGNGKRATCPRCDGKGTSAKPARAGCPACDGTGTAPDLGQIAERIAARHGGIDAALRAKNVEVMRKAVDFLLSCRASTGEFALRDQRETPDGSLGRLNNAYLFSNAIVLWALLSAGVEPSRPEVARAYQKLEARVRALLDGRGDHHDARTQAASLALRALLAGGSDPSGELVTGLVKRLVAAQRPGGHWADDFVSKEPGDAFDSLFVVESLWLAQRRGAKVPTETFSRALSAGIASSNAIPKSLRRNGFLPGTSVASGVALVLLAKAGTLGPKVETLDEIRALPLVSQGLAWLDRHFEVAPEPLVVAGARARGHSDSGWAAWIYATVRLGRLLSIEEIGGRRWYADGCRRIAELQGPGGDFEERGPGRMNGPVRTTVSVLLFLARATPSITEEAGEGR